jgi:spermidine synthase
VYLKEEIVEKQSDFHKIEVFETNGFGKLLVIDDNAVFCEADEFISCEMMAHVGVNTHKEPKDILIIGGGDLGIAREVLKHECIERVDSVDIDKDVFEVCKGQFSWVEETSKNEKLNIFIENGVSFIKRVEDKSYDIVFVNSTNEVFDKEFYNNVSRVLKDDGLVVTQGGSWFLDMDSHKELLKIVGKNFSIAMPYKYEMLCYEGGLYNFILASKKYHPTADINLQRADLMDGLKYYNSDIHIASFVKPTYVFKELLGISKN